MYFPLWDQDQPLGHCHLPSPPTPPSPCSHTRQMGSLPHNSPCRPVTRSRVPPDLLGGHRRPGHVLFSNGSSHVLMVTWVPVCLQVAPRVPLVSKSPHPCATRWVSSTSPLECHPGCATHPGAGESSTAHSLLRPRLPRGDIQVPWHEDWRWSLPPPASCWAPGTSQGFFGSRLIPRARGPPFLSPPALHQPGLRLQGSLLRKATCLPRPARPQPRTSSEAPARSPGRPPRPAPSSGPSEPGQHPATRPLPGPAPGLRRPGVPEREEGAPRPVRALRARLSQLRALVKWGRAATRGRPRRFPGRAAPSGPRHLPEALPEPSVLFPRRLWPLGPALGPMVSYTWSALSLWHGREATRTAFTDPSHLRASRPPGTLSLSASPPGHDLSSPINADYQTKAAKSPASHSHLNLVAPSWLPLSDPKEPPPNPTETQAPCQPHPISSMWQSGFRVRLGKLAMRRCRANSH